MAPVFCWVEFLQLANLIHEKRHEKRCFRVENREFKAKFTKSVTIPAFFVKELVNRGAVKKRSS